MRADDRPAWVAIGCGTLCAVLLAGMHFGKGGERAACGVSLLALLVTAAPTWEKR